MAQRDDLRHGALEIPPLPCLASSFSGLADESVRSSICATMPPARSRRMHMAECRYVNMPKAQRREAKEMRACHAAGISRKLSSGTLNP
jgi:hypothetical protein